MILVHHKTKQFFILLLKLLIIGGSFYFIYARLSDDSQFNWAKFKEITLEKATFWDCILILFLSFLNRFLEILKWKNLVQNIKPISTVESSKQVLGALTLGLFTPNNLGEYAGKALFFDKELTKKIIFLNVICNGIQLLLTIVFGIFGLLYFNAIFTVLTSKTISILFGICLITLLVFFFSKKITFKGYSLEKLIHKVNSIPKKTHQKNTVLGLLRYLTFSHQYYFLFVLCGVQAPYWLLMATIVSVYFLASALPTFQFLDFAVKGGMAVYFLHFLGVNDWIPVFVSTVMWILNTVIPVVAGSYFVLNFKPKWS